MRNGGHVRLYLTVEEVQGVTSRVVRELDRLVALRGRPLTVVSDNGTELTSHVILRWQNERGVDRH